MYIIIIVAIIIVIIIMAEDGLHITNGVRDILM